MHEKHTTASSPSSSLAAGDDGDEQNLLRGEEDI